MSYEPLNSDGHDSLIILNYFCIVLMARLLLLDSVAFNLLYKSGWTNI